MKCLIIFKMFSENVDRILNLEVSVGGRGYAGMGVGVR